jgi:hypothetical protein
VACALILGIVVNKLLAKSAKTPAKAGKQNTKKKR